MTDPTPAAMRAAMLIVVAIGLLGCNDHPADREAIERINKNTTNTVVPMDQLSEMAFRAGANVAAKLIWEHPYKYHTSLEVQDAAVEYLKVFRENSKHAK